MNRKDLIDLIEEGENIQCEFKRHFTTPEKIAREMIAFANTKGGYILFGIDDDKKIIGVESEKSEAEMINDAANNYCEPPLKFKIDYIIINNCCWGFYGFCSSYIKRVRLYSYIN